MGEIDGGRLRKRVNRSFQVNGVPECDGGDYQVEPAGSMALIFKGPISDLAKAIEEDGTSERISGLSFIKTGGYAASERWVFKPCKSVERTFHPADLPQCKSQAVLTRLGTEFAKDQRGGHGSLLD
jgi:hypothetical protein